MYSIEFTPSARRDVLKIQKSSPQLAKKLIQLIEELREHPYTGTGKPEQLKFTNGIWSRRLDKKNRIRYIVQDDVVIVTIFAIFVT